MGIPEWMLSIDSRKTKILHNGACIQFLIHFKGLYRFAFCSEIHVILHIHFDI